MNKTINNSLDIKNLKAAKRYAKALAEVSKDKLDIILADLDLIDNTIFQNAEFKMFFLHPVVSLKDKKETIKAALEEKIDNITLNFLETLLDENRFNLFSSVKELFKQEFNIIKNKQVISVISTIELKDYQKNRLEEYLSAKLSKDVILNYEHDEDILGGLLLKLEDNIIDLSLKAKFNSLKKIKLN